MTKNSYFQVSEIEWLPATRVAFLRQMFDHYLVESPLTAEGRDELVLLMDTKPLDRSPIIIRRNQGHSKVIRVILDGNLRLAAAVLRGEKRVTVREVRFSDGPDANAKLSELIARNAEPICLKDKIRLIADLRKIYLAPSEIAGMLKIEQATVNRLLIRGLDAGYLSHYDVRDLLPYG